MLNIKANNTIVIIVSIIYFLIPTIARSDIINPEIYIQKNGYHSIKTGDDGKTPFYTFTEKAVLPKISKLEKEIAVLPKHQQVFSFCEFMRGGIKAQLIQSTGKSIDVAISNYGYSGAIIACNIKYMYKAKVGTQLVFIKKANDSMYIVYVTD